MLSSSRKLAVRRVTRRQPDPALAVYTNTAAKPRSPSTWSAIGRRAASDPKLPVATDRNQPSEAGVGFLFSLDRICLQSIYQTRGDSMARVLLDGLRLVDPAVQDLGTPGMTPVLAIERALEVLLRQCFMETFSDILIKPPSVKIHSLYFKQRFASLPALLGTNYETWYPEITVATRPADNFDDVDLASSSMDLVPIIYGGGISRIFQLKKKQLKRQMNHVLRINHIKLGKEVIQAILDRLSLDTPPQPLIANFDQVTGSRGHRLRRYWEAPKWPDAQALRRIGLAHER